MCPSTGGLAEVQSDQLCYGLLSQLQIQVLLCLPMLRIKLPVVMMFLKILFTSNDCWRVICSKWIQMLWSIMQYKMNLEAKVKFPLFYPECIHFLFRYYLCIVKPVQLLYWVLSYTHNNEIIIRSKGDGWNASNLHLLQTRLEENSDNFGLISSVCCNV